MEREKFENNFSTEWEKQLNRMCALCVHGSTYGWRTIQIRQPKHGRMIIFTARKYIRVKSPYRTESLRTENDYLCHYEIRNHTNFSERQAEKRRIKSLVQPKFCRNIISIFAPSLALLFSLNGRRKHLIIMLMLAVCRKRKRDASYTFSHTDSIRARVQNTH